MLVFKKIVLNVYCWERNVQIKRFCKNPALKGNSVPNQQKEDFDVDFVVIFHSWFTYAKVSETCQPPRKIILLQIVSCTSENVF